MQPARLCILLPPERRPRRLFARAAVHRGDRRVAGRERSIHAARVGLASAGGAARDVPAARVLSRKRGIPRPCGSEGHLERSDPGDADVHRSGAEDAARRHAGLHPERPAKDADRFRRGYGSRPAPALRAVCRSDERLRDVSGWALHRSGSHTQPASTIWTSTAPITRSVCTTRPTIARYLRGRTGWSFRSAPENGSARPGTNRM